MNSKKTGYFLTSRTLLNDPMWTSERFTRGQAWIDLIGLAQYKPSYIRVRGNKVNLQRGDVGWSVQKLALRWQWDWKTVKKYLNELQEDGRISLNRIHRIFTVISIKNYNKYQPSTEQNPEQTPNRIPNRMANRLPTNNKRKERNISINTYGGDTTPTDFGNDLVNHALKEFEAIYGFTPTDKFPRKSAWNLVQRITTLLKSLNRDTSPDNLKMSISKYFAWVKKQDWSENIQNLDTIKRKLNIFEAEVMRQNGVK